MLKYSVLGSGSSGNAYMLETDRDALLIDNGFSVKEVLRRMALCGHDPVKLRAILLTHEHHDHVSGVGALGRRLKIPVFLPLGVPSNRVQLNRRPAVEVLEQGSSIQIGVFTVTPWNTSHDTPVSCGFTLQTGDVRIVLLTDSGATDAAMIMQAETADIIFLETNYDTGMLLTGSYPRYLKQRIDSDGGHLSNASALAFLSSLGMRAGRRVYLCHLSRENNSPAVVEQLFAPLRSDGLRITVCPHGESVTDCLEGESPFFTKRIDTG